MAFLLAVSTAPRVQAAPPVLTPGVWTNITPTGVVMQGYGFNFVEIDPSNPLTLYATVDTEGMWKTTDGGGTWTRLGDPGQIGFPVTGYLDSALAVRVDPNDPLHLYASQGVRGQTLGFWVSTNGGVTWTMPAGFIAISATTTRDVTMMAVNPDDFRHILLSSHSSWPGRTNAGILESRDGGATWTAHPPMPSWGSATCSVNFLRHAPTNQGDDLTWLLGQEGSGHWRTTDGGATWDPVSTMNISHGGGHIYYTASGVLYTGGKPYPLRSVNNGETWTALDDLPYASYYGVWGDGNTLYALRSFPLLGGLGDEPYQKSAETDGLTWTPYQGGAQTFDNGPYEVKFDAVNGIMYSANWYNGLWALKVIPPGQSGPTAPAAPSQLAAASPSSGRVDLSWTDNASDEQGFVVERSGNGGATYSRVATKGANATTHQETGLPAGSYTYRVRSYKSNLSLLSAPSNAVTVAVAGSPSPQPQPQPQGGGGDPVSAIKPLLLTPGLQDGVDDSVDFGADAAEVEVIDSRGRSLYRSAGGSLSWNGRDARGSLVPTGFYVARIAGKDGSVNYQKILVTR